MIIIDRFDYPYASLRWPTVHHCHSIHDRAPYPSVSNFHSLNWDLFHTCSMVLPHQGSVPHTGVCILHRFVRFVPSTRSISMILYVRTYTAILSVFNIPGKQPHRFLSEFAIIGVSSFFIFFNPPEPERDARSRVHLMNRDSKNGQSPCQIHCPRSLSRYSLCPSLS